MTRRKTGPFWGCSGRATVFGAGVWATHFIAALAYLAGISIGYDAGLTAILFMAAVTLVPDPLIAVPGHAVAPTILALAIGTVMALIAGLGVLGAKDNYMAERLRRSADHLARAQRIAHTGSIEQDLRTGAIEWS